MNEKPVEDTDIAPVTLEEEREVLLFLLQDLEEERQQIEQAREVWIDTVDAIDDLIFVHDSQGKIIRANEAYRRKAGMKFKELIGKTYWEIFPIGYGPSAACQAGTLDGKMHEEKQEIDGQWWHTRSFSLDQASGIEGYGLHIMTDITEEMQSRQAIERYTQTLRIISLANQKLIRISSETELLQDVCDVIVENSQRYVTAWIAIFYEERLLHMRGFAGDSSAVSSTLLREETIILPEGCPIQEAIQLNQNLSYTLSSNNSCFQACGSFTAKSNQNLIILPLSYETESYGVMVVYAEGADAVGRDEIDLFEELAGDTSYGIYSRRLQLKHQQLSDEAAKHQRHLLEQTILAFGRMVEARDPYTAGHQFRVAHLAVAIAQELGWEEKRIESVRTAGMIHDIGKIKLPADILSKPGALEAAEFELLKTHSASGEKMLHGIVFDSPIAKIIGQHHERLDGSGYPLGLKGDEILPEAKLIAVADVVEAMMSHRPYRTALGLDVALEEITLYRGIHFDPQAVDACVALFREKRYTFPSVESQ